MSYNIVKFPKDLSKIYKYTDFKNYCLNPFGYKVFFFIINLGLTYLVQN